MKILFILLLSFVPLMAGAEIYRSVDDAGHVTYSDLPGSDAKPARLPGLSTYEAPSYGRFTPGKVDGESSDVTTQYTVEILKPEANANVRSDGGSVEVKIDIEPPLRAGINKIMYRLDDDKARSTTRERIYLQNLSRGPHTLRVWIADKEANAVSPEKSVGFFLSRGSDLFHPPPSTPPLPGPDAPEPGVMQAPRAPMAPRAPRQDLPRQYVPRSPPATAPQ